MHDNAKTFRLQWLRNRVEDLNTSYYAGEPEVTDAEYDALFQEMKALETELGIEEEQKHSNIVGSVKNSQFSQQVHRRPMLSLKTEVDSSAKGFLDFDAQVRRELFVPQGVDIEYISEVKFDGIGLNLQYNKGILTTILTRGDGEVGEDVTHALPLFGNSIKADISNHYPYDIEIRGEAMMTKEDFQEINKELEITGQKKLANPRNAAAGSVRVLDLEKIKLRKLIFFPYSIGDCKGPGLGATHKDDLTTLFSWGFTMFNGGGHVSTANGYSDSIAPWLFFKDTEAARESFGIEIDGVVHKVNLMHLQESLGYRSREPRWAVAQKFPPTTVKTRLYAIDVQVGRSGKLTPVGKVMPVNVHGVLVSKATLHNLFDLRRRGVRVGDEVTIQRAGDVIPEIAYRASIKPRETYVPNFRFPKTCPSCGSPVVRNKGEASYYCTGKDVCKEQIIGGLLHFVSRGAMDIRGLGEETIKNLVYGSETFRTYLDIYKLPLSVYATIGKMGSKNAEKLMKEIEKSKTNFGRQFLYGLGIRQIGAGTARRMSEKLKFEHIVSLALSSPKALNEITGEGEVACEELHKYFSNNENLQKLRDFQFIPGVKLKDRENNVPQTSKVFEGMNIVITGHIPGYSRTQLKKMVENNGGTSSSNVSKKTSFLVTGENPTKHKIEEAKKLEKPILQPQEFLSKLKSS